MRQHRVRLTDDELSLVVSALRARLAMMRGARRQWASRLIERLDEGVPGNPSWRFGWESHGDLVERLFGAPSGSAKSE
jgi:hypothetical protein